MQITETTSDQIAKNPNAPLSFMFTKINFEGFSSGM